MYNDHGFIEVLTLLVYINIRIEYYTGIPQIQPMINFIQLVRFWCIHFLIIVLISLILGA